MTDTPLLAEAGLLVAVILVAVPVGYRNLERLRNAHSVFKARYTKG